MVEESLWNSHGGTVIVEQLFWNSHCGTVMVKHLWWKAMVEKLFSKG